MTAETKNKNALIIFSRLPIGKETKTRLSPILNEIQREELHKAMWTDIFSEAVKLENDTDIYLYWTGNGDINDYIKFIPSSFQLEKQEGKNLGEKMSNALMNIFNHDYKRAAVIGSDIPSVTALNIQNAFNVLNDADVVIGPSNDGGYWLIGMKKFIPEMFNISSWGNSSVIASTIEHIKKLGASYSLINILQDIDTPGDIKEFIRSSNNDHATYNLLMGLSIVSCN